MALNCDVPIEDEERNVYLGENKKRVRELGEALNKLGGFNTMLSIYNALQAMGGHPVDLRELECAWHEVGEWLS